MIFVIDSTNIERISEAHEELAKLMAEKRLKDALLLIYANKQVHTSKTKQILFCMIVSNLSLPSTHHSSRLVHGNPNSYY